MGSKITMYREKNLTYRTEILAYRDSRLDSMPGGMLNQFTPVFLNTIMLAGTSV